MESRDDSCQTKSAQNEAETEMVHIGHKSCSDVEARVIFGAKGDDAASANELINWFFKVRELN